MDFTNYPNIAVIDAKLGGTKQTMFNKKAFAKAEEDLARLGYDMLSQINYEAQSAVQVLSSYVMPSAVICMQPFHVLNIIPVNDIIWVYGHVVKNSTNFIPTSKDHSIRVMTRTGSMYILGQKSTNPFTKKDITGDLINQIAPILSRTRPGIFFGYSDQIANAVQQNLQSVVNAVDERCYNANSAIQNNNAYDNVPNGGNM